MNYLFHEGGKYKKTNSKSSSKLKKGGNFLGSIGELVAPTGWESFVTTAGLFALDRADASFRRVKKEKKNTMKGCHKSKAEKEKMRRFREIMGWELHLVHFAELEVEHLPIAEIFCHFIKDYFSNIEYYLKTYKKINHQHFLFENGYNNMTKIRSIKIA